MTAAVVKGTVQMVRLSSDILSYGHSCTSLPGMSNLQYFSDNVRYILCAYAAKRITINHVYKNNCKIVKKQKLAVSTFFACSAK